MIPNRMSSEVSAAVIDAAAHHNKLDDRAAAYIIGAWLRAKGAHLDNYGNYKISPTERYKVAKRNLQHQEKYAGAWRNLKSLSKLDAAANLVRRAADATGRHSEVSALLGAGERRRKTKTKAAAGRASKRAKDDAVREAKRRIGFSHNRLALAALLGDERAQRELNSLTQREVDEIVRGDSPARIEAPLATIDAPPMTVFEPGWEYEWIERLGGVDYTVWIANDGPGAAIIQIGSSGGIGLGVHPRSRRVMMLAGPVSQSGDAYASGALEVYTGGVRAALFMVTAQNKRAGAGARVLRLWCGLMAAYGIDLWLAEAVGPEGRLFIEALARKGELEVIAERDANMVVRCSFGQQVMFARRNVGRCASGRRV